MRCIFSFMNHDCISSLGSIPNEPKRKQYYELYLDSSSSEFEAMPSQKNWKIKQNSIDIKKSGRPFVVLLVL